MSLNSYLPALLLYTDRSTSVDGATRFQKLIFLIQKEANIDGRYKFRPDRFGPYSIELRADLEELETRDIIQRNIITNYYGDPKIVYGLTDEGIQKMQKLASSGDYDNLFDTIQWIKQEYNDEALPDLLQYIYSKYPEFTTATELDVETLFDPDAETEVKISGPDSKRSTTIGDQLKPTPYTLWQLPKTDANAYFYFFTDLTYKDRDSKFKPLDNTLTLMGRNRGGLEVVIIDRDQIREPLWATLLDGVGIDNYPALVVSEGAIGMQDVDLTDKSFEPENVSYTRIENGIISDSILNDNDDIRDFLNALCDAARDNNIKSAMREEKIRSGLSIAEGKLENILSLGV